ncbi:MAG: ester cyclase [Ignavibacteria bacterium]|nr:ester cyclase [Ignavibacteria bacterium]
MNIKKCFAVILCFAAAVSINAQDKLTLKIYDAYSVINMQQYDKFGEYITEDFIEHSPFPGQQPGLNGLKDAFRMFFKAFPDLRIEVKDVIVSGDMKKAAVMIRLTGTNKGEWMGMPPSGKTIDITGLDWLLFKDEKASEHWGYWDSEAMMTQLGMK